MPLSRTQTHVSNRFRKALDTAYRIYFPLKHQCAYTADAVNQYPYHPFVASRIVGLAFLSTVAAWEEFVEETFLRYMLGAKSETGFAPRLIVGQCRNRSHALRLLTAALRRCGSDRQLPWHDFAWVRHVAKVFFHRGEPYTAVPKSLATWLEDAVVIRDRVSQNSGKVRAAFNHLASRHLGVKAREERTKSCTPGQLLVSKVAIHDARGQIRPELLQDCDCLFEAHLNVIKDLAYRVAPFEMTQPAADRRFRSGYEAGVDAPTLEPIAVLSHEDPEPNTDLNQPACC